MAERSLPYHLDHHRTSIDAHVRELLEAVLGDLVGYAEGVCGTGSEESGRREVEEGEEG